MLSFMGKVVHFLQNLMSDSETDNTDSMDESSDSVDQSVENSDTEDMNVQ